MMIINVETSPIDEQTLEFSDLFMEVTESMYCASDAQELPLRENGSTSGQRVPMMISYDILWSINDDKAFITPQFKKFLKHAVDSLNKLYDNDCKHGAIGDLDDSLKRLKKFLTGSLNIDEEEDQRGFLNKLDQLKPKEHECHYFNNFQEILEYTMRTRDRSFKDTLLILKSHPLLSDSSYKKKITSDLCSYWDQCSPHGHTFADEKCFSSLAVGTSCDASWQCRIGKSNVMSLVLHRLTGACTPRFSGLVLFVTNILKDLGGNETVSENVQASLTEDVFFELYELFPDFYIIIFKYIYCSQRMFAQLPSGPYPSDGYNVMNDDFSIRASQRPQKAVSDRFTNSSGQVPPFGTSL